MEFLAPSYTFLITLRQTIETGASPREALRVHLATAQDPFSRRLAEWALKRQRQESEVSPDLFPSPLQRAVVATLDRGLSGEPILSRIEELEEEMRLATNDRLERHLQRLPILMLMPLVFLIFPSVLLLLLGPIVHETLMRLSK